MNIKKFNERMGKPKFSKGGYIKKIANREYFDGGGIAGISSALGLDAKKANIGTGVTPEQLDQSYKGSQNALDTQSNLTNTLTPQAGTAVNNQNTVANQELAMTRGEGPNPALNMLNQQTGKNIANQAAVVAGQRGSSMNPGLAARTAGMTGANLEENAVGQGATLAAQQQIGAQNALTNLSNQQVGQAQGATTALNTAEQNEQNILQNANTSQNNANVTMQGNMNNINAQNNQKILGGITSGIGALSGGMFAGGGEVGVHPDKKHKLEFIHKMTKMGLEHFDMGGSPTPTPSPSNGITFGNAGANAADVVPQNVDRSKMQGVMQGFRQTKADGGMIENYMAEGGPVNNPLLAGITNSPVQMPSMGYNSVQSSGGPNIQDTPASDLDLGKNFSEGYKATHKTKDPMAGVTSDVPGGEWAGNDMGSMSEVNAAHGGGIWNIPHHDHAKVSAEHFSKYFAKGGESKAVPAMVSPGERYWHPEEVEQIKHGADPMKLGTIIPGKAKVPGKDSLKNDVIPATLEEGGIVNPLHIEKKKDSNKSRLFVLKSLKATGKHMKKPAGMK